MILPIVNTILGALIRCIVTVYTAHSVSRGHLGTRDFSIDLLETLEQGGVIYVALGYMVQEIANISQRKSVCALVLDVVNIL